MPKWELIDFETKRKIRNPTLIKLLKKALEAKPTPDESEYFVRAAAMTASGKFISGGIRHAGYARRRDKEAFSKIRRDNGRKNRQ